MIREREIGFDSAHKELKWNSDGLTTKLSQSSNKRITLTQEKNGHPVSYSPYSDTGHKFFGCLLRYLKESDNSPTLENITSIDGTSPEESRYRNNLDKTEHPYSHEKLPFFQDNKIRATSISSGQIGTDSKNFFLGYVHDKNLDIGISSNEGITVVSANETEEHKIGTLKQIITLDKDDALNALKGIYFLSPNKELLEEVYNSKNN